MTSILTNTSAMRAVSALAVTQRALATTENQITTGLRVSSAKDNAAYWSIASSMNTRIGELHAVNDGLDATGSLLAVTTDGLNRILKSMQNISKDVVQAHQAGIDLQTLQDDIAQNQQAISDAAAGATFSGQNLLDRNWTQTAVVNETSKYDGGTFVSGSGAETYTWSDGQGTSYSTQDTFTLTNGSVRTYTSFGSLPLNPMDTLPIVTGAPGGGALQTTDLDTRDINVFGVYLPTVDDSQLQYPNEDVNDTIVNSDPHNGPDGVYSTTDLAYEGRNHVTPPPYDGRGKADELALTHTFEGQEVSTGGYPQDPYVTPAGNLLPPTNVGGDTVFVQPDFSIMSLSLTNNVEHFVDGSPTQPYVLTADDLDKIGEMVADNIDRVTQAMAEVGSEQNLVDGSKSINIAIMNALTSGVGSLVDTDMNAASIRLAALQTQQQLGTQALGIANDNASIIMKLFGN